MQSYSKIASYMCVLSFQLFMSRRAYARKSRGFGIRYLFGLPCVDELLNFSVRGDVNEIKHVKALVKSLAHTTELYPMLISPAFHL